MIYGKKSLIIKLASANLLNKLAVANFQIDLLVLVETRRSDRKTDC